MFPPIDVPRILETTENTLSGFITASPNAMARLSDCFFKIETYRLGRMKVYYCNHPVFRDVFVDHIRACPLRGPSQFPGDITFSLEANFSRGGLLTANDLIFYSNGEVTTEIAPVHSNFLFFAMPAGSSIKITGNVFYNSSFDHSVFLMGYMKFRPLMKGEPIPEVDVSNPFDRKLSSKSLRYDSSNESVTISPKISETVKVFDLFEERRGNESENYRYFIETDGSWSAYEAHTKMLKLYEEGIANGDRSDFSLLRREQ